MRKLKQNNKLIVNDVTKIFSQRIFLSRKYFKAVNKVSLEMDLDIPEVFSLVGESGSGKTTLANLILNIIKPDEGDIFFKARDITKMKSKKDKMAFMKDVQPVFQDPFESFDPMKKVEVFLYETVSNFEIARKRGQAEAIIEKALGMVGLSFNEVKGKYPGEFSGGQLQRIAIARSLAVGPSILIADEPVSMLDASLRISIVNLFKALKEQQNLSVLYITHDLATAYYVSDRIGVMLRGNLVEVGKAKEILDEPLHPYTQFLKQSVLEPDPDKKKLDILQKQEISATEVGEYQKEGCKFSGRCPKVMDICREKEPGYYESPEKEVMVKCFLYGPS